MSEVKYLIYHTNSLMVDEFYPPPPALSHLIILVLIAVMIIWT